MKLAYPAIFEPLGDRDGYTVTVPDLPGCVTEGDSLTDAIDMATDAASGWVLDELEDGKSIPTPSKLADVQLQPNQSAALIIVHTDAHAKKRGGEKAVRKNCTIPAWLNTFGERANINFSRVLAGALERMYMEQIKGEKGDSK